MTSTPNTPESTAGEVTHKSLASQIFSLSAVKFIVKLRALITLPILSRLIGAEGFGIIASLAAFSGIVVTLIILGSGVALRVFVPGMPPEQRRREFWGMMQVTLIVSSIFFLLILLLFGPIRSGLLPSDITFSLYLVGILIIPTDALQTIIYCQILNNREGKAYSQVIAVASLLELICTLLGAYWFGLIGVLGAIVMGKLIICIGMVRIIHAEDRFTWLLPSHLPDLKKYYVYGLTIFVAGLAARFVDSGDRLVIGSYLGSEALGIYQVAYNMCSQLGTLAGPITSAILPFVSGSINTGNPDKARSYLEQSYRTLLLLFVPMALMLSLTARDILTVLTTPAFVEGAVLVPFVVTGVAFSHLNGVYIYTLHAYRRGHVLIYSTGCAALVNLGLNLLFVPRYGIIAAAIATLLAYILICGLNWYFAQQSLKISFNSTLLIKLATASLGMAGIVLTVQTILTDTIPVVRLIAAGIAGGSIYLVLVYVLQVVTSEEQQHLWQSAKAAFLPLKRT